MGHVEGPLFTNPQVSRARVDSFVSSYGRTKNPELPPQDVHLGELLALEDDEGLLFGPGIDVVDYVFSQSALGLVKIDVQKGTVSSSH